MKTVILKVKPNSMFRLGSGSLYETDKIIHSDTLFSAIIDIHSHVFENTDNFIGQFSKGNISISSAFPMLSDDDCNKKIFFIPKPEIDFDQKENIKAEKKIKYLSFEAFKQIDDIRKHRIGFSDSNYFTLIGKEFVTAKSELASNLPIDSFISELVIPKTKVHSTTQDNSFYHETDVQLKAITIEYNSGKSTLLPHYYFLYESKLDEKLNLEFLTCLRILADSGIGGERSTGKGQFEGIIETELEISRNVATEQQLLLSLCNPNSQNEFNLFKSYEIVTRGGGSVSFDSEDDKIENEIKPYRKKQVRMIAEGAIVNGNVEGRFVDVSPEKGKEEHKYFRNGKCFTIPIG